MAELNSEEEQIEAIKRWWKQNGISLLAGVVLAAAGVFGWNAWQDYQNRQAEAASIRYQQLVSAVETASNDDTADAPLLAEGRRLANQIQAEHSGSLYAELAVLLDARLAIAQDDLSGAISSLKALTESSQRDYLKSLAQLRLARLTLATDTPEAALTLLDQPISDALAAQHANVRGDAYHALDRHDQASDAWQQALNLSEQRGQALYGVRLKLDDLGTVEPAP